MAKQARRPKKRGPKEERLAITDRAVALARLRRPTKTAVATLREDFRKAHADGMAALNNQDFDAFGDAIKRERDIIETQREMIERSVEQVSGAKETLQANRKAAKKR